MQGFQYLWSFKEQKNNLLSKFSKDKKFSESLTHTCEASSKVNWQQKKFMNQNFFQLSIQ